MMWAGSQETSINEVREAATHLFQPEFMLEISTFFRMKTTLLQVLAPGDQIMQVSWPNRAKVFMDFWKRLCWGTPGSTQSSSQDPFACKPATARWARRLEFPAAGAFSMMGFLCDEDGRLHMESQADQPSVLVFEPCSLNPNSRTQLLYIKRVGYIPPMWLANVFFRHLSKCIFHWLTVAVNDRHEEGFETCCPKIVCVKKLSGKAPLMLSAGGSWVENHNFTSLTDYLQTILSILGVKIRVWSSLDGWELPYYQSVVLNSDWDQFSSVMGLLWGRMTTAYRYLYGGPHAPQLKRTDKPHLMRPVWSSMSIPHTTHAANDHVLVRAGFFHIPDQGDASEEDKVGSDTRSRAESAPPHGVLHDDARIFL